MSEFKREARYIVVKPDCEDSLRTERLKSYIDEMCFKTPDCVVVEADWPEYELVWRMIESRVMGLPNELEYAQSELAALREELATAKDDAVIFKAGLSALGEASRKLVLHARTTGGTAGPDQGLMDACAGVEGVITLAGIARAMDEAEQLTAERDDLKVRLENARDRKSSIVDLQQRLADAERRNELVESLLRESLEEDDGTSDWFHQVISALRDRPIDSSLTKPEEAKS